MKKYVAPAIEVSEIDIEHLMCTSPIMPDVDYEGNGDYNESDK